MGQAAGADEVAVVDGAELDRQRRAGQLRPDRGEADREVTTRAGLLEQLTDTELRALLNIAPRAPGG